MLPDKAYWPPALIYLQAAIFALLVWYLNAEFYADDAYISLKYAKNLLDGQGLTWNPGERLEGYTNFLFTLAVAGLGWLGLDLVVASRLLSFAGYFATLASIAWYIRRFTCNTYAQKVCAALAFSAAATSLPLLGWCLGGLEGNLFTCFISIALCLSLALLEGDHSAKKAGIIGLTLGLATLTRPEGALFAAGMLGFLGAVWLLPATRARVRFCELLLAGAVALIIIVPYLVWRVEYYGQLLPNTVIAKTHGIEPSMLWGRGLGYLAAYIFLMPPLGVLFAGYLLFVGWRLRRSQLVLAFLGVQLIWFLAYVASVGGDHMPYMRFMLPMAPVIALILFHGGRALLAGGNDKRLRDVCAAFLVLTWLQIGVITPGSSGLSRGALSGLAVADHVRAAWPAGSLVALNPVGALPYAAPQHRYIDMLGLLDAHIAQRSVTPAMGERMIGHLKGDGAYVFSRKPDYIIFGYGWGDAAPIFLSDVELDAMPEFAKAYTRQEVYITPPQALLPALKALQAENKAALAGGDHTAVVNGPVLNEQDQLRFLYYQRK